MQERGKSEEEEGEDGGWWMVDGGWYRSESTAPLDQSNPWHPAAIGTPQPHLPSISMTTRTVFQSTQSSIMSAVKADCHHLRPRRFAPLDTARKSDAPPLKGIVFDVDGTLW